MANQPAAAVPQIELIQSPRIALAPFEPSEGTLTQWLQIFEETCMSSRIRPEPVVNGQVDPAHNSKRAFFLASVGRRAYAVLEAGCAPDLPNTRTIPQLSEILRDNFEPPDTQAAYDLAFSTRNQLQNESVVQYIQALRQLATKCNFGNFMERAIILRLRSGLREPKLRQTLNADAAVTLGAAQTLLINAEANLRHERMLLRQSPFHQAAHSITSRGGRSQQLPSQPRLQYSKPQMQVFQPQQAFQAQRPFQQTFQPQQAFQAQRPFQQTSQSNQRRPCFRCTRLHDPSTCPAVNWSCNTCHKVGHIAKCCRSTRVNHLEETPDNSPDFSEDTEVEYVNFLLNPGQRVNSNAVFTVENTDPVRPSDDIEDQVYDLSELFVSKCFEDNVCVPPVMVNEACARPQPVSVSVSPPQSVSLQGAGDSTPGYSLLSDITSEVNPVFSPNNISEFPSQLIRLEVSGKSFDFEADTGAGVSIMSQCMFERNFSNLLLSPVPIQLSTIAGEVVVPGQVEVSVNIPGGKAHLLPLVISAGDLPKSPLLGRQWLDVLFPSWRIAFSHSITPSFDVDAQVLLLTEQYPNVFSTDPSAKIKNVEVSLDLKDDSKPVFKRAYPVPYALTNVLDEKLDAMISQGKIIPVEYSEWASPCLLVPKNGKDHRLVIDYKKTVNPNLKVPTHPPPHPQDLFSKMSGAKYFCLIDLAEAYTQLRLDAESQKITVFSTPHRGLFKCQVLMYGLASAPSLFQRFMDRLIAGLPRCVAYLDDCLVSGETISECLANVHLLLKRFEEFGVRVNFAKCKWFMTQVEYLGFVLTPEGRKPSPKLVSAIVNAPQPRTAREVRAFVGLVNFYAMFLPNLSTLLHPLYQLTRANVTFQWTEECSRAFAAAKQLLVKQGVLIHFNPNLDLVLCVDASPVGAGAVLAHRVIFQGKLVERPIAFASLAFTDTQCRYSQLDREALAIMFGVRRFHQFVAGRKFTLVTDNAPLRHLYDPAKPIPHHANHRLQHWASELSAYQYDLEHRRSDLLCHVDALSRLPESDPSLTVLAHMIDCTDVPITFPLTAAEIAVATQADPILSKVVHAVSGGWTLKSNDVDFRPYAQNLNSLSIQQNCLMFGNRVIIPTSLRKRVLDLLHQSHPGVVRTKLLAKSHVWWPGISTDIESFCSNCTPCAVVNFSPDRKEVFPWPKVSEPFERVFIDFFELEKQCYFILCDSFSKWIGVYPMTGTTAKDVIAKCYLVFSIWGLPASLVADNGPPFGSREFTNFCTMLNVTLLHPSAYHPCSNAYGERAVNTIKKCLKKVLLEEAKSNERVDTSARIVEMLFNYNNTPSTATDRPPNSLLLRYTPRTLLTALHPAPANQTRSVRPFKDGDLVLVQFNTRHPVEATIIRQISTSMYLVDVAGTARPAHFNQLSHGPLTRSDPFTLPRFMSLPKRS